MPASRSVTSDSPSTRADYHERAWQAAPPTGGSDSRSRSRRPRCGACCRSRSRSCSRPWTRTPSCGGASRSRWRDSAPSSPGAARCRGSAARDARRSRSWRVATLTLIGNFVLYLVALDHATPSVTQVVIQLAPLLLLVGGVLVFRERLGRRAMGRLRDPRRGARPLLQRTAPGTPAPGRGARPRRRADGRRRRVLGDLRARAEAAAAAFLGAAGPVHDLRRRDRPAAADGDARGDLRARRPAARHVRLLLRQHARGLWRLRRGAVLLGRVAGQCGDWRRRRSSRSARCGSSSGWVSGSWRPRASTRCRWPAR